MRSYKKIIKSNLFIRLIIFCFALCLVGFFSFKYFNALFAAKFDLKMMDLNTEYPKSSGTVLDTRIFDDPKFKFLNINKDFYTQEDVSTKSNPFESYERKNDEESESEEND